MKPYSSYIEAINAIERHYPGHPAKMLADFIDAHVPHDPESDERQQRDAHETFLWLCEVVEREGLPPPPSMQQR